MPASGRGEVDMRFCSLLAHSLVDGHRALTVKDRMLWKLIKGFSFSWAHRGTMEVLFKWGLENSQVRVGGQVNGILCRAKVEKLDVYGGSRSSLKHFGRG